MPGSLEETPREAPPRETPPCGVPPRGTLLWGTGFRVVGVVGIFEPRDGAGSDEGLVTFEVDVLLANFALVASCPLSRVCKEILRSLFKGLIMTNIRVFEPAESTGLSARVSAVS